MSRDDLAFKPSEWVDQTTLDSYLVTREEKERLLDERVIATLKEYEGSVKVRLFEIDADSRAIFGISWKELEASLLRLTRKGIAKYITTGNDERIRRIYFMKSFRAALSTPEITN